MEEDSDPRRFGPTQKVEKIRTQEDSDHLWEDSALGRRRFGPNFENSIMKAISVIDLIRLNL